MKCVVCKTSANEADNIIEDNWVPCFYEGDSEHGPVCPFCSGELLSVAPDGEFELKKKYKGKIVLHDTPEMLYEEEPTDDIVLGFILN
ncbi:MAG: hypothetical protein JRJ23_02760 [Deltaproteobacteria bacterium]|jgi:hypothetical protein|nr:hypothetical protein [Deltaproteobacteria bacterium]MBW1915369.1 hypothetical protein [Deltaproteobacteria bacterium]